MTSQPGYQRGDRIALEHTTDPYTRLTPGTQGTVTGYDPRHGQLHVAWDDGSTLTMLLGDGDRVRLLAPGAAPARPAHRPRRRPAGNRAQAGGEAGDGHPPQDITDPATGLSRLLSERCSTCILRAGDPMHLGPQHTAEFIRQTLARGTYVTCHQTLTYGDHPDYGPAICRGFFEAYAGRSPALILLRACRRLIEVPPPPPGQPQGGG